MFDKLYIIVMKTIRAIPIIAKLIAYNSKRAWIVPVCTFNRNQCKKQNR